MEGLREKQSWWTGKDWPQWPEEWHGHASFRKACDVKNSYKSLGFNNHCFFPVFMQKAAATVVWSYQCFQNVAQDWCTEQLMCVISASCVTNGAPSPGTSLWQVHCACGSSHNAPWFMTSAALSLWKSVFCWNVLQHCMVKREPIY